MNLPFPWVGRVYQMLRLRCSWLAWWAAPRELFGRKSKCFVKGGCRIFFSCHGRGKICLPGDSGEDLKACDYALSPHQLQTVRPLGSIPQSGPHSPSLEETTAGCLTPSWAHKEFESTHFWQSKCPSSNSLAWKQISAGVEGFPLALLASLSMVEFVSQDLLLPLVLTPYHQTAWGLCCKFGLSMPLGRGRGVVIIGLLLFCPV